MDSMLWDVFCRVIDNWGDIGVCWRLAADLRARGEDVRLWVDDPEALRWMAPDAPNVMHWDTDTAWPEPGDVVIEAFGGDLPEAFVGRMAGKATPPVWINLEYLTAEPYAQRSHGLRSPQQGVGRGLNKFFFYPGWVKGTGGLLREKDLSARQASFDPIAWLQAQGIEARPHEQRVSLFCYRSTPALPGLLSALQAQPTLLLVAAGQSQEAVRECLGDTAQVGQLRVAQVPALTQREFDHLLWSADVNLVRGEDSFVRAQWAGRPFVWQIYPQEDGAHAVKLEAFHQLWANSVGASPAFLALSRVWNGLTPAEGALPWPQSAAQWSAWRTQIRAWGEFLAQQPDLTTQLQRFVDSHKHRRQG